MYATQCDGMQCDSTHDKWTGKACIIVSHTITLHMLSHTITFRHVTYTF